MTNKNGITRAVTIAPAIVALVLIAWQIGIPEEVRILTGRIVVYYERQAATQVLQARADAIDSYFERKKMPLAGYGAKFAAAAEANGLDWRLMPAIAVRESSGGLHACGANVFGWASCKRTFKTIDEAIETVALHLGGNASTTARIYGGKTTEQKLKAYNPPSIVPHYADEVAWIMEKIGPSPKK